MSVKWPVQTTASQWVVFLSVSVVFQHKYRDAETRVSSVFSPMSIVPLLVQVTASQSKSMRICNRVYQGGHRNPAQGNRLCVLLCHPTLIWEF